MIEWLGIEHLFELSGTEAVLGFLTPLIVFVAFALVQIVLPGRRVPGYVVNEETGEPRSYRLNGLIVYVILLAVWATEITGMPRDWFYRSSVYAVAGGTALAVVASLVVVFTQARTQDKKPLAEFWTGRVRELQFFGARFDVKMWMYAVGGAMLALNALSGAAYHYEQFGADANPGVYLYAAIFTLYIFDYFIFERVQLYTFDLIHERLGFMLIWGCLVVYPWLYILPLWGMAAYPDPGFSSTMTYAWLIGVGALALFGWSISRGANLQKAAFKQWPDRKFLWIEPKYIEAGERKILYTGFWGAARHFNYFGEGVLAVAVALTFGYPANLWAWIYFAFIVSMFTNRQRDDDHRCAEKYGAEKWAEYQSRVRYRILPGVY